MPSLDLHRLHVHEAWKAVDKFVEQCYYSNHKRCEIICGQGAFKEEI